ncbi:hypothetical protein NUM3379_14610 [Kineococcus sp. NUM-3379]
MSGLLVPVATALAGGAGAAARYAVDTSLRARLGDAFPWPTLAVNVSGSLLLGFLAGLAPALPWGAGLLAVAGTGFCGGYTTFSTAAVEVVRLHGDGVPGRAAAYAAGSLLAGVAAALLGLLAGTAAGHRV